MEGAFFVLIGAALFSHSWYLLELYPDGRTMGTFIGGLGLAALITITMSPMLFGVGIGIDKDITTESVLAETTVMKTLIIMWSGYAIGVGAQGLWDFDERAIGFYGAVLTAVSAVALFFFIGLFDAYGNDVWISMAAASLALTVMAGMLFFYLAVPFNVLRPVAAWFILVGSVAVTGIGLAIISTLIRAKDSVL